MINRLKTSNNLKENLWHTNGENVRNSGVIFTSLDINIFHMRSFNHMSCDTDSCNKLSVIHRDLIERMKE